MGLRVGAGLLVRAARPAGDIAAMVQALSVVVARAHRDVSAAAAATPVSDMPARDDRSPDQSAKPPKPASNLSFAMVAAQRSCGPSGRPAVVDDEGSWTAEQLQTAVAGAAAALRANGVGPGDRVVVALRPGRTWLRAFLGAVHLGAIAVPIDPDDRGTRVMAFLEDIDPCRIVADDDAPWPADRIPSTGLDHRPPVEAVAVAPGDCAFVIATSGSTGRSKGVMHAHGSSCEPGYVRDVLGVGPYDRVLSASAGFSALGLFIGILRPLASGACVVMSARRPTVRSIITVVADAGVTTLSAVPTFWAQLAAFLERHPAHRRCVAELHRAVSSGEPLPPAVARRLRHVTGVELLDGYGSAECGDIVIGRRPGEASEGLGRPAPGVDIRLEPLTTATSGASGRLVVRTRTAMLGYWGRPDEAAELHDGWLRTGDIMSRRRGELRHEGRVDGVMKLDGRWLRPADAEACLYEHPSVVEAAVVAVRSRREVASAAVFVTVGGRPPEGLVGDLRRLLLERVGQSGARARVTVVDQLPRLSSGKLDRRALVESVA